MAASTGSGSSDGSGSAPGTVSAAVSEHLRRLCLHEFPCGAGSWNRSRFLPPALRAWKELVPGEEPVEALLGLVRSPQSPWALPKASSAEDRFLRELAIQSPLMIRDTFFYSYFRSLRLVDKQVTQVDRDLLKFLKLEELILSANRIKEIDPANLPPTLKVLELYGNELGSVACLCATPPPPLQHLGLGQNRLRGPSESACLTASHWPSLVSLDLGFNDLTDLQAIVAALRSLGRLRLLVLQGNPLALLPHYRGFTVDSLARLCVLDDVTVSPHERQQFRGLAQQGGLLAPEAQLVVTLGNLRGITDSSVLDPEPGPEGPFITYSYYVTYGFLEDEEEAKASESGAVLAEIVKPLSSAELPEEAAPEEPVEESAESVETTEQAESSASGVLGHSVARPPSTESAEELGKLRPHVGPRLCPALGTVLFSTEHKPWADVITCNYEAHHSVRDLGPLKAFLLAGTTVTVVEEKILSWPVVTPAVEISLAAKKGKGESARKKDKKEKDRKGQRREAEDPSKEKKASQKKRESPKKLRQDPPTLQVLGSDLLPLEPLLAGEPMVSTVCNFGVVRTPESDRLTFVRDSKNKKGARKERTKRAAPAFEGDYQPEPLTVEVEVHLSQVRSAEEAQQAVRSRLAQGVKRCER